jgi:hypothetical protein
LGHGDRSEPIEEVITLAVFTVTSGGVPAGNYTGSFVGVEPAPPNTEKGYGPGVRWKFRIDAGPHSGQTTSRITGPEPSPLNACGKMLAGLAGRPIQPGDQIDPEQYLHKRYMIVVAASQGGGTRVDTIIPVPTDLAK